MPEYVMPGKESPSFEKLHPFTQAYIEAALWTNEEQLCEESNGEREMPDVAFNTATMESRFVGGNSFGFEDLAPETLQSMIEDCRKFRECFGFLYEKASDEQAGHDFWLTRNGHGAGFWDRPELYGKGESAVLTSAAKKFGESSLYCGDDGKIYAM